MTTPFKVLDLDLYLDLEWQLDGVLKCPTNLSPLFGACSDLFSSFQVDFFAQYGILSFWLFFNPKNTHFWTNLDLEWHLDGV